MPSSRESLLPVVQHQSNARSGIWVRNSPPQLRLLSWFSAKKKYFAPLTGPERTFRSVCGVTMNHPVFDHWSPFDAQPLSA